MEHWNINSYILRASRVSACSKDRANDRSINLLTHFFTAKRANPAPTRGAYTHSTPQHHNTAIPLPLYLCFDGSFGWLLIGNQPFSFRICMPCPASGV